jgi:hypothetical protein
LAFLSVLACCAPKQGPELVIPQREAYPAVVFDQNGCLTDRQAFILRERERALYESALIRAMEAAGFKPPAGGLVVPRTDNRH